VSKVWKRGPVSGMLQSESDWNKTPRGGGTLEEGKSERSDVRITSEQVKALRDWQEEVVDEITSALSATSTMTSTEDFECATLIYDHLLELNLLKLPDLPDAIDSLLRTLDPGFPPQPQVDTTPGSTLTFTEEDGHLWAP
jgi:hypothetical protein